MPRQRCTCRRLTLLLFHTFLAAASLFTAQAPRQLTIGSPAPTLSVRKWLKGKPIPALKQDATYVVEFWATWCQPCKACIPHLTQLAARNRDVSFIGISIWEEDHGANIQRFVNEMGPRMNYSVGYSGNRDGMAATWMAPSRQSGIPVAFVIKRGKILWIGNPMAVDDPRAQIKASTFDIAGAKETYEQSVQMGQAEREVKEALNKAEELHAAGKHAEASGTLDALAAKSPQGRMKAQIARSVWLAKDDGAAWRRQIDGLAGANEEESRMLLGAIAIELERQGDEVNGRAAMATALKATQESDIDTLLSASIFYQDIHDKRTALRVLKRARTLAASKEPYNRPEFLQLLDKDIKALSTLP